MSLDVGDIRRSFGIAHAGGEIKWECAFYETLGLVVVDGSVEVRNVTLQKADCRIDLYQGHLDPPVAQLIF